MIEEAAQELCDIISDAVFHGRKMTQEEQSYFDKLFDKTLAEFNTIEATH